MFILQCQATVHTMALFIKLEWDLHQPTFQYFTLQFNLWSRLAYTPWKVPYKSDDLSKPLQPLVSLDKITYIPSDNVTVCNIEKADTLPPTTL